MKMQWTKWTGLMIAVLAVMGLLVTPVFAQMFENFSVGQLEISGTLTTADSTISGTELNRLDGITAGTVLASKALVVDANKDLSAIRDVTVRQTINTGGVGAKNGATVTAVEYGDGTMHRTVLTLAATPITITDDAGVAQYGGTAKVYDFPDGQIVIEGAVVTGDLTLGTTGTIINTYNGDVALGTITATTGATLVSTEADIMASAAIAEAVTKVSVTDAVNAATTATKIDGTSTAKDMFLNFVVDDDASHTSGTGTWTGTITITWINAGDYS